VCAPTFARLPVVPGRRHRACGAGTGRRPPVTCMKNRNPPAVGASSVPAPEARLGGSKTAGYPGTGKLAGSSPAPCCYAGLGQLSRKASGVNSGCRIPHLPGRNPPTHHIRPDGRAEPR
jgi:hypothetical protein